MDTVNNSPNHPISIITNLINIPFHTTITSQRWTTAVSMCLKKKLGQPQTDKIRIIHLFEADLNGALKTLWGHTLPTQAEKLQAYPDAQYGGRQGRSAIDAVTIKRLAFEYSIVTRNPMLLMDNDATACYDCIITPISSICCQQLGMTTLAEDAHNDILLKLKYHIKTAYSISPDFYQGTHDNPLQGQGQGSGNAPSCWNATSAPMWHALRKLSNLQYTTMTPDHSVTMATQGVAFMDDAITMFNNSLKHPANK